MHIYLNILNMLKYSLYICVHIISTAVCRDCVAYLQPVLTLYTGGMAYIVMYAISQNHFQVM